MEKSCFKCGRTLPIEMFYRHPQMGDGHINKCKECTALDVRLHREKNGDDIRRRDRARSVGKNRSKGGDKYKTRRAAQSLFWHAIERGKIIKPLFCVRCWSAGRIHGHHYDYSKALDVVWLCESCHATEHMNRAYDCNEVASLRSTRRI